MLSKKILKGMFKLLNISARATAASASFSIHYQPKEPKSLRK